MFLDPNLWTEDGTATVGEYSVGVLGLAAPHAVSQRSRFWLTTRQNPCASLYLLPAVMSHPGSVKFTDDGSLMAYTRGDKGSDWRTIYIMDTSTGSHLGDRLQHAK